MIGHILKTTMKRKRIQEIRDNNVNYVAPDGSIWVTNLEAAGRRLRRNMLKELCQALILPVVVVAVST